MEAVLIALCVTINRTDSLSLSFKRLCCRKNASAETRTHTRWGTQVFEAVAELCVNTFVCLFVKCLRALSCVSRLCCARCCFYLSCQVHLLKDQPENPSCLSGFIFQNILTCSFVSNCVWEQLKRSQWKNCTHCPRSWSCNHLNLSVIKLQSKAGVLSGCSPYKYWQYQDPVFAVAACL